MSKKQQLVFYNLIIPKQKRRTLWTTNTKDVNLAIVMEYYNITQDKAHPYMSILTQEQINELEGRLNKGGKE